MIEINFRSFLTEFNGSKFVVYFSLLTFFLFLALKLDGFLPVNYFFIFIPIWFGESLVFVGFIAGLIGFVSAPPARLDISSRNDFFAMCFCTLEHILLLMFEVLCCYKLHNRNVIEGEHLSWLLVFSPLFVESFMAMIISVWCIRHDKTFEFEMFFSINIVQFVFIAFKLDNALHWNWVIVFVPTWVMFSLFFVGTLYSLIISIFLGRSLHVLSANRRSHIFSAICHFILSVPLLAFFLLLSSKLDAFNWLRQHSSSRVPYIIVSSPLLMSLAFLLFFSFGNKSGNTWWFGMRKPFCTFVFDTFPCLQQYANISYKFGYPADETPAVSNRLPNDRGETTQMLQTEQTSATLPSARSSVVKLVIHTGYSIETPD